VNGKIPVQILDKVEKELESTMWNEYLIEYMPQQIEIKSI
jgi:hypothetical protein